VSVTEIFHEPEFWVLAAFVILLVLLWKPLKPLLIGALDTRAEGIREELETANRLRQEAEEALESYRRRQQEAAAEAAAIAAQGRADAERLSAQAARDLEDTLRRRRQLAAERVAQEQQKAIAEVRAAAINIAIAAARRVVIAELDATRGAALIDAAIAALPQQLR
jgi:F-type H+-transporting ATPase subunit b